VVVQLGRGGETTTFDTGRHYLSARRRNKQLGVYSPAGGLRGGPGAGRLDVGPPVVTA
jgi:hypothetical protein